MKIVYTAYLKQILLVTLFVEFFVGFFDVLGASNAIDRNTARITANTFGPFYEMLMPGKTDPDAPPSVVLIQVTEEDLFGACGERTVEELPAPFTTRPDDGNHRPQVNPYVDCEIGYMGGPTPIEMVYYQQLIEEISSLDPQGIFLDVIYTDDQEDVMQASLDWSWHGIDRQLVEIARRDAAPGLREWDTGIISGSSADTRSSDANQRRSISVLAEQNAIVLTTPVDQAQTIRKWPRQVYYAPPAAPDPYYPGPAGGLMPATLGHHLRVEFAEMVRERMPAAFQLYFWKCALALAEDRQIALARYPGCSGREEVMQRLMQIQRAHDSGQTSSSASMSLIWASGSRYSVQDDGAALCSSTNTLFDEFLQALTYLRRALFSPQAVRERIVCPYFDSLSVTEFYDLRNDLETREKFRGSTFIVGLDFAPYADRHQILDVRRHGTELHAMALDNLLRLGPDFKQPSPETFTVLGWELPGSWGDLVDATVVTAVLLVRIPLGGGRWAGFYDLLQGMLRCAATRISPHPPTGTTARIRWWTLRFSLLLWLFVVFLVVGSIGGLILYRLTWVALDWSGFNWIGTASLFAAAAMTGLKSIFDHTYDTSPPTETEGF